MTLQRIQWCNVEGDMSGGCWRDPMLYNLDEGIDEENDEHRLAGCGEHLLVPVGGIDYQAAADKLPACVGATDYEATISAAERRSGVRRDVARRVFWAALEEQEER